MNYGFDLSHYQDDNATSRKVDFKLMQQRGAKFVILKATNNVAIDEDFEDYYHAASDVGLPIAAYHFYEYRKGYAESPTSQAEKFLKVVQDKNIFATFLDYERPNANWPSLPSNSAEIISKFYATSDSNIKTGFYSNLDCIKNVLQIHNGKNQWLTQRMLWLAWYPNTQFNVFPDENVPVIPNWPVAFWQFSAFMDGLYYGVESKELDANYFMGTDADFEKLITGTKKLTIEERLARIEKILKLE
jgi:lysozyme